MSDWVQTRPGRWSLVSGSAPRRTKGKTPIIGAKDIAHVSLSLPRGCPGARKYDKLGHPIVETMADIRNIEAATGYVYAGRNTTRANDWQIRNDFPERSD